MSERRHFISRFTPSRTDPADLESILVQRHDLLRDAVERAAESARSRDKHHLLFIGPRGSGKTHFVTLLFHRVDAIDELKDKLRIAWLNEDETCPRVLDLLLRIHSALEKKYPMEFPADFADDLRGASEEQATARLIAMLLQRLGDRYLLVIVENLDELFKSIGETGQKALRALLQNHPVICLVATAQGLFDGVQKRSAPFFGFFQIEHFKPLSVDEATELLANIARLNGDAALTEFLQTSSGRARIRVLHHLSGGNHRIYIVLSEFITRDSVEELVRPFEEMIDELTPYYQERVRWLAPLQRRIVEFLCRQQQPTAVKAIASSLFASHQTITSQLKTLRELGYLESYPRGRESLYELSEPLMRLCVEVKENQRREPLRLIVDFLRVWYDEPQLEGHLQKLPDGAAERFYVTRALEMLRSELLSLRAKYLLDDLARYGRRSKLGRQVLAELTDELLKSTRSALDAKDGQKAIVHLTHCIKSKILVNELLVVRGIVHHSEGRADDALSDYNAAIAISNTQPHSMTLALVHRGKLHAEADRTQDALSDFAAAVQTPNAPSELVAEALLGRARAHHRLGHHERVVDDLSILLELNHVPQDLAIRARFERVDEAYVAVNRPADALADANAVLVVSELSPSLMAEAHCMRGIAHVAMAQEQQAQQDFSAVLGMDSAPQRWIAAALAVRAQLANHDHPHDAIADLTALLALSEAPAPVIREALLDRAALHHRLGSTEQEIADYTRVLELGGTEIDARVRALFYRAAARFRLSRWDQGLEDLDAACGTVEQHPFVRHAPVEVLIETILRSGLGEAIWANRISSVLGVYAKHGLLAELGAGLVRSLNALPGAGLDASGLDAWRKAWFGAGEGHDALRVPFRIFSTGIDYLKTGDRGVLLDRLKEERRVLVEALKLDDAGGDG
jgi:tetratricopeptide (TPR) repeat protein